jgi:Tol biopolymer transport system component
MRCPWSENALTLLAAGLVLAVTATGNSAVVASPREAAEVETVAAAGGGGGGRTSRVSVSSTGVQGDSESLGTWISAGGRYVAFTSEASNLVPGDTNGWPDAFVRDRRTGTTTRITVSSTGAQANGGSFVTSMSPDGRYVAFQSDASNLVPGDTNGGDAFMRDLRTGVTSRISLSNRGRQGNDGSSFPKLSDNGRYVAFLSGAANLVPVDTNQLEDIFVRDRRAGTTSRVNISSRGAQANGYTNSLTMSGDGRYVTFFSAASNLVPGDTNGENDLFVHDRRTGITSRANVSTRGTQANDATHNGSISGNGRYIVFDSRASNLSPADTNDVFDVFLRDLRTGTTSRVDTSTPGRPSDGAYYPAISADGRHIAFQPSTGDGNDVFVRDRRAGITRPVTVAIDGGRPNGQSYQMAINADGRCISFSSRASNLVPDDTNDTWDVFVHTPTG